MASAVVVGVNLTVTFTEPPIGTEVGNDPTKVNAGLEEVKVPRVRGAPPVF